MFSGEASDREIERIASFCVQKECRAIIASGGDKVIDTVKVAAEDACAASVIAPTNRVKRCSMQRVVGNL